MSRCLLFVGSCIYTALHMHWDGVIIALYDTCYVVYVKHKA